MIIMISKKIWWEYNIMKNTERFANETELVGLFTKKRRESLFWTNHLVKSCVNRAHI